MDWGARLSSGTEDLAAAERNAIRLLEKIRTEHETDGNLPTGKTLKASIEQVGAATAGCPSDYMVNCAHPKHFGNHRALHLAAGFAARM
jgi:hypothetical protein